MAAVDDDKGLRFRSGHEPRSNDTFIAIMGVTGSGKSTFISQCCEAAVTIGHDLEACTQAVAVYPCTIDSSTTVFLIDTPGFDDTKRSDSEVLREIAAWLTDSFANRVMLSGIIYLHRITDNRMQGSAKKNILLFKKLCGENAFRNVALASSMWDKTTAQEGTDREKQLKETPEFWGWMVGQGSKVFRHTGGKDSAMKLINHLVPKRKVVLDLQHQMVNDHLGLHETGAGIELRSELANEREIIEQMIRETRVEIQKAIEMQDAQSVQVLKDAQKDHDAQLERLRKNNEDLMINTENLWKEREAKFRLELQKRSQIVLRRGKDGTQAVRTKPPASKPKADGIDNYGLPSTSSSALTPLNKPLGNVSISLLTSRSGPFYYWLKGPISRKSSLPDSFDIMQRKGLIQVCLGQLNTWIAIYRDDQGNMCKEKSTDFDIVYPKVWKTLEEANLGDLEYASLGPGGNFFARFQNGYRWTLPTGDMGFNVKEDCSNIHQLALGEGNSYVVVRNDGSIYWNLRGRYDSLNEYLGKEQGAIEAVALDMESKRRFMLIRKNGSVHYNVKSIGCDKWKEMNFGQKAQA